MQDESKPAPQPKPETPQEPKLDARQQRQLAELMADFPGLTRAEALRMLNEAGF